MNIIIPTKAITVYLWGSRVGALLFGDDGYSRFQYFPEFVKHGVEIAPFAMPLSNRVYNSSEFELPRNSFWGLPGVFADSLPDSFGNRLVAEWMRRNGFAIEDVTPLDRLAYVGARGMGALVYEPEFGPDMNVPTVLDMRALVEEARLALNADLSRLDGPDALREIIRVGTSAGGAQAKAIVALEMGYDSIDQMFRRMVFNVLAGECDDHAKNFSFMMTQGGRWKLAPAYDLTGRQGKAGSDAFDGWINRHALSVNGRFSNIRDDDLVLIGERYGLGNARSIVEEIKSVLLD